MITGWGGPDNLFGKAGQDAFVFASKLSERNIDKIHDFKAADDVFLLKGKIFKALDIGDLSDGAFTIGHAAKDAGDRIVYNKKTGVLSYDADGHGGADAKAFAKLVNKTSISADDFFVY
jgi:serralysin